MLILENKRNTTVWQCTVKVFMKKNVTINKKRHIIKFCSTHQLSIDTG